MSKEEVVIFTTEQIESESYTRAVNFAARLVIFWRHAAPARSTAMLADIMHAAGRIPDNMAMQDPMEEFDARASHWHEAAKQAMVELEALNKMVNENNRELNVRIRRAHVFYLFVDLVLIIIIIALLATR